ncbi:MAG: exosome complex exonuclease Rrp41 [Candidatus Njordarchaeia archaeon]
MEEKPKLLDENGIRNDGRKWDELRPLRMEVGVLKRPVGSAIVEMGKTKVLAAVYGPKESFPKHLALPDKAILKVAYRMASFSVDERKKPQPSRREIELSKVIKEALEPALFLDFFPRTTIEVYLMVLQADGGTRTAAINAASLALAEAGIPMKGLVSAVAVGLIGDQIVVDLNYLEDGYGDADIPMAMIPVTGEITLLQMDGMVPPNLFEKCLDVGYNAIKKIHEEQKKALRRRYEKIREKILNSKVK